MMLGSESAKSKVTTDAALGETFEQASAAHEVGHVLLGAIHVNAADPQCRTNASADLLRRHTSAAPGHHGPRDGRHRGTC